MATAALMPGSAPPSPARALLVVAGLSVRALAAAARRGGWAVIALDAFGDADTRALSRHWFDIADRADRAGGADGAISTATDALPRINPARLCAGLRWAAQRASAEGFAPLGWVAGAGFEACPELLQDLVDADVSAAFPTRLPLLGLPMPVVQALRDPPRFFATLDDLAVPHPPVSFRPPLAQARAAVSRWAEAWLRKDFASSAGLGVCAGPAALQAPARPSPSVYWQRRAAGRALGALALADAAGGVGLIGVHQLCSSARGAAAPWVYTGVIGPVPLSPAQRTRLLAHLNRLVPAFGLRGLFSSDWLFDDAAVAGSCDAADPWSLLEINPRPSASLALYDREPDRGGSPEGRADASAVAPHWLAAHVAAFDAGFGAVVPARAHHEPAGPPRTVAGERVVYAPAPLHITPADVTRWLRAGDVRDLPALADGPALDLPAGVPVCSLFATGPDAASVEHQLARREADLLRRLLQRPGRLHPPTLETPAP